jgi:uncharacterized membrane protein YagU involved in acid resistance
MQATGHAVDLQLSGISFARFAMMSSNQRAVTPAEAAVYGMAAGLAATMVISALTRIPAIRQHAERASLRPAVDTEEGVDVGSPMSPAAALVQTSGSGPEGAAGLFAAKLASGLFGRDLARRTKYWGRAVHVAYGTFWGLMYGILQTSTRRRPAVTGPSHGLFVWAFGPALLVPAMKLMPPPAKTPAADTAVSLAAHIIYGVTTAELFNRLIPTDLGT